MKILVYFNILILNIINIHFLPPFAQNAFNFVYHCFKKTCHKNRSLIKIQFNRNSKLLIILKIKTSNYSPFFVIIFRLHFVHLIEYFFNLIFNLINVWTSVCKIIIALKLRMKIPALHLNPFSP